MLVFENKDDVSLDPNDRSPNNPAVLVSKGQILRLYRADLLAKQPKNLTWPGNGFEELRGKTELDHEVKVWFAKFTREQGWLDVQFRGAQALLYVHLPLIPQVRAGAGADQGSNPSEPLAYHPV